ncbi:MAG: LysR family transcriptional regulator [Betaproteobacteria bacterium]|nr:LysR family transcriptional regulator [Betaproteobacteria bacterium]
MNIHQLQAVCNIARHRYNISAAAETLERSQSGLSRQVKELELELGVQIFLRTRNKVIGLTPHGERILRTAQRILQDLRTLEQIGEEEVAEEGGELRVATTHVHARYLLPGTVKAFARRFPRVALTLQQSDPVQCRDLIAAGEADVGIITMVQKVADPIVTIPAYRLPRCVIVPLGHPLVREQRPTLQILAEYPLIAYPATFSGRSIVERAFARAGLKPRIVCSATDADVCKAYVEVGMGIAVLAKVAFDSSADHRLAAIDAGHLFLPGILNLVLRKHGYLTRPLESFLAQFAPHIDRELILNAIDGADIERARLAERAPVAAVSRV